MDGQERRVAFLDGVAKIARSVLRERWPGVAFEVRPQAAAHVQRLDVAWKDGPTRPVVAQLVEESAAAVDGRGDAPRLEVTTRRSLTEDGVAAALLVAEEDPPPSWLTPQGDVSWQRFDIREMHELMARYTLPEPPVSAHHLAALLANRLDLSVALADAPRRSPRRRR